MDYIDSKIKQKIKEEYYRQGANKKISLQYFSYFQNTQKIHERYREELELMIDKLSVKVLNKLRENDQALEVSRILTINKSESYVVGGFVRDTLLELESKDIDFVTDIPYDTLRTIFSKRGYRVLETGKEFLVMIVEKNGYNFEISNFRKDGTYTDGRRPDAVEIGTLEEDANRRDFCINSLYFCLNTFTLKDPNVLGLDDIFTRTLRFIGNPKDRIKDDYLRVFRWYRFLNTKGLKPNKKCQKVVRTMWKEAYNNTSPERAILEIEQMAK